MGGYEEWQVHQFDYNVVGTTAGVGSHNATFPVVEKVGFGCTFDVWFLID